jgi:hypothetical protein
MDRGVLLKHFRPALVLLAVALFSASAWADGIDPRVIIQKGSGSIPITGQNPNPSFPVPGQPALIASVGSFNDNGTSRPCLTQSDACVSIVFQNQTSQTVHNLTIAINDLDGFSFECGDSSQISFFSSCSSSDNGHVTDVNFSGGIGILPAVQSCVAPTALSSVSCKTHFTGGEFGLLIDATGDEAKEFAGQSVSGQTLTTPEPDAGILMLSAAFAFGLLKLLRRGA